MSAIDEAVEAILATYGNPLEVARGYKFDNAEIMEAMKDAVPNGNVAYALTMLANLNPPPAKTIKD
jgi:hypothetical protein